MAFGPFWVTPSDASGVRDEKHAPVMQDGVPPLTPLQNR